jgi:glutamyl-tRNA reductase
LAFREALSRRFAEDHVLDSVEADEYALLSTCNRFELYLVSKDPVATYHSLSEYLKDTAGPSETEPPFYRLSGRKALRHLFRVASGLESVVVGEPQILAQVRVAGVESRKKGNAGAILSPVFDRAYRVGARVRAAHGLGSEEVTLSDLAVEAVGRLSPGKHDVMLLGTGKMIRLAARRLKGSARKLYVVSRRRSPPAGLEWCTLVGYRDMRKVASKCDVLISATTTGGRPLLTEDDLKGRRNRIVVDLGMPRNVAGTVRSLPNVRLIDLDDLARLARPRKDSRKLKGAEAAAAREASEFYDWLVQTRLNSTLAGLHAWADSIRREELERATGKLNPKSEREARILDAMGRRIVSKIMARPTRFARRKQRELSEEEKLDLLGEVFGDDGSDEA